MIPARVTVESIDAQIAAANVAASAARLAETHRKHNERLARQLLALGQACFAAVGPAANGTYWDGPAEASVTNAGYDVFEVDALHHRFCEIIGGRA